MPAFEVPREESRARTWARRLVSIPAHLVLLGLVLLPLPAWLALAAGLDVARGLSRGPRRWPLVRLVALGGFVAAANGVALAVAPWVAASRRRRARAVGATNLYVRAVVSAAAWLHGWTMTLQGSEDLATPGRVLVLARHVSWAETLFPILFMQARHGILLRYVLKTELRWLPPIDLYGEWMGYAFVCRGGSRADRAREQLATLGARMPPDSGVVIYPEGTRWTPEKAAYIREKLAREGPPEWAALAQRLQVMLPPRPGGTQALRAAAPEADVMLYAHTGFERGVRLGELLSGGWVGLHLQVRFERLDARAVPVDPGALERWLAEVWERLDAWVLRRLRADS